MRALFALPTLLLTGTLLLAQQGTPPAQDPNAQLDSVLDAWEKSLTSLRSMYAVCQRTTLDKVFQTKEVFKGSAKYMKAPPGQGSRASLELVKVTNPQIFEKYLCTGTFLYEYAPASKVIRIHDLPPPKPGQIADDNFMSFLFGMKAAEAKQRYQINLSGDQYYHYLQIQPRLAADKADFSVAQLVLRRDNLLPARVWFHQPNGNEVTWEFQARRDVELPAKDFEQPQLPPGWNFERMSAQAKPKIRSNGP